MSWRFNPFHSTFEWVTNLFLNGIVPKDYIEAGETVTIQENYQYLIADSLKIDGVLKTDGKVVVF